jgi:hypothetical protein
MGRAGACLARLHERAVLFNASARNRHDTQGAAIRSPRGRRGLHRISRLPMESLPFRPAAPSLESKREGRRPSPAALTNGRARGPGEILRVVLDTSRSASHFLNCEKIEKIINKQEITMQAGML